ncbi:MAG: uroporphyrinogen decarboxylase family protein [Planctomycetota bacterium]
MAEFGDLTDDVMTSRELVRRTLAFDAPCRVPRQLWVLPWAEHHYPGPLQEIRRLYPDDIVSSPAFLKEELPTKGDCHEVGTFTDEWGCVFENLQRGVIGEVRSPQLLDWSQVDLVRIPKERLSVDTARVDRFCRGTEQFVLAGACPRPFERLQFLRGTENTFYDLMDQPAELPVLLERMHRFYLEELDLWAKTAVDGLTIMDDWGSQYSMLISPDLWRRMFKPLYREYIEIAHAHGKPMFMHSDGYIADILEDLVELGLDAINCQVFCMDVARLGERFGGRITFWGELDRQQILPSASREEVFAAAGRMKRAFDRGGGLIAQCEFGPSARPENVRTFFEAFVGG